MELFKKTRQRAKKYQKEIVEQMLKLTTSGFGLVAALAWNELIKTVINDYVRSKISVGSGIISLLVYALVVTALAVLVTLQLSALKEKLEKGGE
ncbi:hypothetical protein COT66_00960 [Candidatus Shapirobacteria bacterium CG09_land_8_20_14_0_10_49_15]|uniref:Uncharacterized protein n=2 Tax=Candidatus Shapironibacteriota TaxID=1752721 RepID=A0A2M8L7X4_9BACT|nr:MAG: hypothetical protein COT66_00960 [Candidatus Shapirobacteria bacterium CG09_land_8_20_14_0_10_49_15]PJE70298.1 MAG: hypothetical protein COU97_00480 [Candidatus Shapirobacteria bacterium CG10_big_fil_rev_8_21_14_0_10_48_15]